MAKKKEIKQSKTTTIMRSQINMNPLNPKRHTEKAIALQKKNFQKVGYLGGITFNASTGNLIDGHRRLASLDACMSYDGTPESDYEVKVELVDFDEKTEKEQMTYMALGNTRADFDLIAPYINDIDYNSIGLAQEELSAIFALVPKSEAVELSSFDDMIMSYTPKEEATLQEHSNSIDIDRSESPQISNTEAVKQSKAEVKEKAMERALNQNAYITLSFSSHNAKADFCALLGIDEMESYAKGEEVLQLIQ